MRALANIAGVLSLLLAGAALAQPRTLRVDVQHGGNVGREHFALERIVIEPLPWAGNPARPIDDTGLGWYRFEVSDAKTGALLYSRGYNTVFGEWQWGAGPGVDDRSFQESLRFPMPDAPVVLRVSARGSNNTFVPVWSLTVDPASPDITRQVPPLGVAPIAIRQSGPPATKVDLLILGDGYTAAELPKFEADARRLAAHLFTVSPFRERAGDFNVWALAKPTHVSGVPRPSGGKHGASVTGLRYDTFGGERFLFSLDNRALRELAQYAPYDVIEVLANNDTYGGGGIFGQFSTVAAGSTWSEFLFVHEFGHHFAGLADEYYTSDALIAGDGTRPEPWEPNVTAASSREALKWRRHVAAATPVPTPWPKSAFEAHQLDIRHAREALIRDQRPEADKDALFTRERTFVNRLLSSDANHGLVGAFEGANYEATGYYRSQMQCLMFDRSQAFCQACRDAVDTIIDLYAR